MRLDENAYAVFGAVLPSLTVVTRHTWWAGVNIAYDSKDN